VICLGLILTSVGLFFTGFRSGEKDYMYFIFLGYSVFGFGFAMITIPLMPEILDSIEDKF